MSDRFPRIEPLGEAALLVRFSDRLDDAANRACVAFRADLDRDPPEGAEETASSLGSVLVRHGVDADVGALEAALTERLAARDWSEGAAAQRRLWTIPCSFGGDDGPQLEEAAALAGKTPEEAVAELAAARVRVLSLGFVPGMPYLGILPAAWDLPRQTGLTPKVPEGALVVAVRQFVLFGTEAPTGWRQIGRTLFKCFDPGRDRPIALTPGDEVTLAAVSPDTLRARAEADEDGFGGATFEAVT